MKWMGRNWIVLLLVVVAFSVRMYRISNPVADWHAFRQADTASVTREYVKHGVDLLRPRYQDLSNIQSGTDNLDGYRMVEFPFVNAGIALALRAMPFLDLVVFSRLMSVFASLGTLLGLWILVKRLSGQKVAMVTCLTFALLPYSVYYSRAILPEPFMLFFSTWSITAFVLYLRSREWVWYVVSLIAMAFALLLKPFVLFLAPVFMVLAYKTWGKKFLLQWQLWLYAVLAVVPLYWWRSWIMQFPEGIPASDWLLNGNGIRLRPAWFRWLFWERLTKLMLGFVGVVFLLANLIKLNKDTWVYAAWWGGVVAYFIVVASGNVQHDYYQNLALPILSISVGRGATFLYSLLRQKLSQKVSLTMVGVLFVTMLIGAWQHVSGYFNVNHWEYVKAGQEADRLLPADAKVIAPAFGDTQFLFQTNRTGWPIGFDIGDKIELGAEYYVTASDDDEARELEAKYHIVEKGEGYLILDLTQPKN